MDLEAILVNFSNIINSDDYVLKSRFGFNQENADKFNFAIITKTLNGLEYQEMWILSNAYYDYESQHFVKVDPMSTSFGIQIQPILQHYHQLILKLQYDNFLPNLYNQKHFYLKMYLYNYHFGL